LSSARLGLDDLAACPSLPVGTDAAESRCTDDRARHCDVALRSDRERILSVGTAGKGADHCRRMCAVRVRAGFNYQRSASRRGTRPGRPSPRGGLIATLAFSTCDCERPTGTDCRTSPVGRDCVRTTRRASDWNVSGWIAGSAVSESQCLSQRVIPRPRIGPMQATEIAHKEVLTRLPTSPPSSFWRYRGCASRA